MQLLAEDLGETLDAQAFRAAIAEGRKTWRFLPTLAEIIEAAQPFLAERRDRMRQERERNEAADRRALPAPAYVAPQDTAGTLAETFAKIDANTRELLGQGKAASFAPYAERPHKIEMPAVSDASPALKAMMAEKLGRPA
ncbi:hypothetical protein [Sandarakinorhabdus sp. DWP1-3-1]|uniref:hypothetical protein n=1 Tax=Sandarakinorhabdus sp. DWP1-3-1 TaxID=2804627 RepID=UPI003CF99682